MYLGIDQSLRSSGVAVISGKQDVQFVGTVTPGKLKGAPRLAAVRQALRDVLAAEPDIKGYAYDVGAGRVFELGEIGAVVKLVLHDAAIPFVVVPPASLKQFVADHGQAKKEQMRQAVLKKWGQDFEQDDICDAFGLAQVARSFHLNKGTTRSELEVLKKLRDTDKKISLVSFTANTIST
jgi:Holliday junction resolvasome RuvABC endonuclease subunit